MLENAILFDALVRGGVVDNARRHLATTWPAPARVLIARALSITAAPVLI